MIRIVKKIAFHPVFIYLIIAALECISYNPNSPKRIQNEMPKIGDNFGIIDNQAIYYYTGKGKYSYPSADCYFSHGNPTFDTPYNKGGIKTIPKAMNDAIPLLGSMCDEQKGKVLETKNNNSFKQYFSINFLLDHFSNPSHVLFYMILAFSTVFYFKSRRQKYWIAFWVCFFGGGFLEGVQHYFIVGRVASFEDQLLNCVGAILGIVCFSIARKWSFLK